jgi:hypothetical protein
MGVSEPLCCWGVDFTSAPSARKPVVVARGERRGAVLRLQRVEALPTMAAFEALLAEPGPWLGGFDLPFGLPRVFVESLGLGTDARRGASSRPWSTAGATRARPASAWCTAPPTPRCPA